ncbi:hypothetical protein A7E78_04460 [Syntrophotalea acetylenivorans]|uniref:HYDIN/VesB/CFA65-like Ig-like domain-containing protein n=1 Tax=Syntrophotalea acetylenivorans TaxID=1842532 RepID=A0A1L3GMJ3_9BACT|nr:DUF1573 domain-containing protein [Syntrophotalea acetylenivorans]APG27153.1 hypothetical protein A7E78_04460 [Syntrophotalea acetylenivorans]
MLRQFIAGLILFASLLAGHAWAAPQIVVEQPTFDFGEVPQGEKVGHTFSFSNKGDEPLLIEKVKSSCGCTAALLSAKTLAPGESGELQANFDSTRFRGAVTKTISLYSNDPAQSVMQLHVKGIVREVLSVVPAQINLGAVTTGKTAVSQATLKNQSDGDLRLENVQTSSPDLVVKLSEGRLPAGQSTVMEIQLTSRPGQNRFRGYVVIPAQGAIKSDLRIPVYAGSRQQTD